jgi:Uma2 family endonuclease
MAVQAHITRMTVDEYEAYIALPENEDRHLELVDGELIEEIPAPIHAMSAQVFQLYIGIYLRANPIGHVFPEVRYKVLGHEDQAHIPDVSFIAADKSYDLRSVVPFMPDLAVEIQSPGQSKHVLLRKARFYLENGCRMVVLTYPDDHLIEVITSADRYFLKPGDVLDLSLVLPGLNIPVSEILGITSQDTK